MGFKKEDAEEDARGRRCECTAFLEGRFSLRRAGGFSRLLAAHRPSWLSGGLVPTVCLLTALLFDAVCDHKAAVQPFEEGLTRRTYERASVRPDGLSPAGGTLQLS